MKNLIVYLCRCWLVWSVYLAYFSLVISCNPENNFRQNIEIILQIHLPNQESLKSANSIAGIKSVTLTVTSEDNKILNEVELTISGDFATGIVKIEPGENIKFSAVAKDENNIKQWQGSTTVDIVNDFEVSIQLISIPPAVSNLQALFEEKSVTLSWSQNNDPDFARYNLYRSNSINKFDSILFTTTLITETVFKDSLVSEGRTYYYKLIVVDSEGFKTESEDNINIPNIHPTQSVLQVDSVSNMVMLSWTQNIDVDFARYDLYRSQSENLLGKVIHSTPVITETKFKDSSVSENTTYFYKLIVLDTEGFNTRSNIVKADIPQKQITASVLKGSVDGSVYLNWNQNTDQNFVSYDLYRSQSEGILGTKITSIPNVIILVYKDINVKEGNIYFYTLVTTSTNGLEAKSNVVKADIPNYPPTASKLQLDSLSFNSKTKYYEAKLSWTQNSDKDFAKYELFRSNKENTNRTKLFSTTNVNDLSFVDKLVIEGNTYYYRLEVFDTSGSGTGHEIPIVVNNNPPTKSALWDSLVVRNKVILNWDQNYDHDFDRYELYRSLLDTILYTKIYNSPISTVMKFEDTKVSPQKSYRYKLIVFDVKGLSTQSNEVYVKTPY